MSRFTNIPHSVSRRCRGYHVEVVSACDARGGYQVSLLREGDNTRVPLPVRYTDPEVAMEAGMRVAHEMAGRCKPAAAQ